MKVINYFKVLSLSILCFGFASNAYAVKEKGECPMSHTHMGHGLDMGHESMDMGHMHMEETPTLKLSQTECASCHGLHGMSHADDVPNLAGQNSIYLCEWLAACRSEGKACESHEDIASKLTDRQIIELSEFYSHMHDFAMKP